MAQRFFSNFPVINYQDSAVRNILLKSQFFKSVINYAGGFYMYDVRDGEKPNTVAYDYYGHSDYTWLVCFCNNIIDPYFDWPLDQNEFEDYLTNKYGSVIEAQQEVLYYYYDRDANPDDINYEYNLNYKLSAASRQSLIDNNDSSFNSSYWLPKTAYDYELEENDAKRSIRLLDRGYLPQVTREISDIFKK